MIRVIVADDHPAIRLGLRYAMQTAGDMQVVAEAGTAEELFAAIEHAPCDVVVTDFSMPGGRRSDGLALLGALRRSAPALPIVLLTIMSFPDVLRGVQALGVQGICHKNNPLTEVLHAVRVVAAGDQYVSPALQDALSDEPAEQASPPTLSAREAEVLRLIGEGLTVTAIAARLNRSIKTISRQKRLAMQKLGLEGDGALIAYLRANHLR